MQTSEILTLFDYSYWATARILRAALPVTPQQFDAPDTSGHRTLRATLSHALRAEMTWRTRLQHVVLPAEPALNTPAELQQAWAAEQGSLRAYLEHLTDAELHSRLAYQNSKGEPFEDIVWHILLHMLNHSTQHRAEAAAMLTDFGRSPGDVDMILYFREKGL